MTKHRVTIEDLYPNIETERSVRGLNVKHARMANIVEAIKELYPENFEPRPNVSLWIAWNVRCEYVAALYGTTKTFEEMRDTLLHHASIGDDVEGLEPRLITVHLTP